MTAIRSFNFSFSGVNVQDVDVHAPTFRRAIQETVEDIALIEDMLTGRHGSAFLSYNTQTGNYAVGEVVTGLTSGATGTVVRDNDAGSTGVLFLTSVTGTFQAGEIASGSIVGSATVATFEVITINHSGGRRGCPTGIPIANQLIMRDVHMTNSEDADTKNGGVGDTMLLPMVIFVPTGETRILVAIDMETDASTVSETNMRLVLASASTLVESASVPLTAVTNRDNHQVRLLVDVDTSNGLSEGLQLMWIAMDTSALIRNTDQDLFIGHLMSASVLFTGERHSSIANPGTDNDFGVTTPEATEGVHVDDIDEGLFSASNGQEAIDGLITARTNRAINGLMEFGSGWPAGNNADYTHEDQDGGGAPDDVNPDRSRFHNGTVEGVFDLPLWCESFGACLRTGKFVVNLLEPPTKGMLRWYAPWPTQNALSDFCRVPIIFPDFASGGSSSLSVAVLVVTAGAGTQPANWTITAATAAGSASASPVQIGSTPFFLAQISVVPFNPDEEDTLTIRTQKTTGAGTPAAPGDIAILSACAYFSR